MQVQLREFTLQEENAEYEKTIENCENKIRERLQEADLLQNKLKVRTTFSSWHFMPIPSIFISKLA